MTNEGNLKKKIINKSKFQDIIFIIIILTFTTALVLGLFPKTDTKEGTSRDLFIYLLMVIPVIMAIYIILISFMRKLDTQSSDVSSRIMIKMMLSFVSVAILPSLSIIIISNNIINRSISELITNKTVNALKESINMSNDSIRMMYNEIEGELKSLQYSIQTGALNSDSKENRKYISNTYECKAYKSIFFKVKKNNNAGQKVVILNKESQKDEFSKSIAKFLDYSDLKHGYSINNISIGDHSILLGYLYYYDHILTIYKEVPQVTYNRAAIFKDSLSRYSRKEFLKPYSQTSVGILLLILALLIVLVSFSVSFFLSRGITRPVLELADAAGEIASGNFDITLNRDSTDELAHLFNSFNEMVKQLDENRKFMYHTQKLEAWRDVAKRLVHEIKNPLTPIRLSAERIQNRFKDGHPEIENIVIAGTETIIEEVHVLMKILSEFSSFARLPEMKGEYLNINPIIENCVNFFLGHEVISFHVNLDNSVPELFIDKILIRQALTNILQNSVDALGNQGNIYIKSESVEYKNGRFFRLSVKDDGHGIEQGNLANVFDPAFSTKESGTGLGLAIVEKIIFEHNGRIYCYSHIGEGAEFIIELPIIEEEGEISGKDINS